MQQDEIIIDGPLMARAFRQQLRTWLWLGPLVAGAILILALARVHKSYTAAVSISMQQPTAPTSSLSVLAGISAPARTYQGILKSRLLARKVERRIHLHQVYGQTPERATEMLLQGIKPEDNPTDGLLYISVTLPGPARLSLHHSVNPQQVSQAAADAANAYAAALVDYYKYNDNSQGAVLLRGADKAVSEARADYQDAVDRMLDFSRGLKGVDPRSMPSDSSDTGGAGGGLGSLYSSLASVQAELKAAQAAQATRDQLVSRQIQGLSSLPTDDPLLAASRARVTRDQADYQAASGLYGPENPAVLRAQNQLSVDQAQLDRETQGVKQQLTTPNVQSETLIQSLLARQAELARQIGQAQRQAGVHRELSGQYGQLQVEAETQLEVLRATYAEAAKIRLDNASAQNRMTVIDPATPPEAGGTGTAALVLISLFAALMLYAIASVVVYLRLSRAAHPPPATPGGVSGNGTGAKTVPLAEDVASKGTGTKP